MLWTGSIGRMRSEQHDYEKERIGGMTDRRIYQNMDDGTLMERYWLWLCSCPGLYRPQIAGLIAYFKDPKRLYEAQTRELMRWKKLADEETTKWVNTLIDYKETTGLLEAEKKLLRRKVSFVSRQSALFPQKLHNLPDCPYGLFYRGELPDPGKCSVAVIGARRCSSYGQQMAVILGRALAEEGYQVISGMASGIDGLAQSACISSQGRSFAVLGSGADVCYPKENEGLYDRLLTSGGILSEYPPMTAPLKTHFPMRNRLISGLSDVVIVVEARAQSGSLITADLALDQGKEVYAVPGRFSDLLSYGCNRLIEQGAGIVLSKDSLLKNIALALNLERVPPKEEVRIRPAGEKMEANEKRVYEALNLEARSIDEIASCAGLTLLESMRALVSLQLKNLAVEVSKNSYVRKIAS